MHELSIALGILELAQKEARSHQAKRVTELEIEIGKLSGVDTEALSFVLESVTRNTELEGCSIKMHSIPAVCKCKTCLNEYTVADLFCSCPACGSFQKELITGKELKLKSLLID